MADEEFTSRLCDPEQLGVYCGELQNLYQGLSEIASFCTDKLYQKLMDNDTDKNPDTIIYKGKSQSEISVFISSLIEHATQVSKCLEILATYLYQKAEIAGYVNDISSDFAIYMSLQRISGHIDFYQKPTPVPVPVPGMKIGLNNMENGNSSNLELYYLKK